MIGETPSFTVSDFVAVFNQTLDMMYPEVEVLGELANLRISKNAWVYFDLKDDQSSLKFFGSVRSLPGPLEEGMLLKVSARPYLHPIYNFSMQINSVSVSGEGSINKAYQILKQKLGKEGLFDEARKRVIPYPPNSIYLVTSKESAAYGDFTKIIKSRWPKLEVKFIDVNVQGNDAPGHIVKAIEEVNQRSGCDALVLIRGGGSKDDLSSFDHELVVRALAGSRLPTLVAVGHERDESLAELAADVRASTPSNAAEILVPDIQHELASIRGISSQLESFVKSYSMNISREITEYYEYLNRSMVNIFDYSSDMISNASRLVEAFDPSRPLRVGFNLAVDDKAKIIKSAEHAKIQKEFSLSFNDGKINVEVKEG